MQDAKDRFSELIKAVRKKPQIVTKHGKRIAVVVAAAEYDRLKRLERLNAPSFKEHLLSMPKDDGAFERVKARLREW
jgi:antitoxin Phd